MRVSTYTPNLTTSELNRCWMTPADVCNLAAVGDSQRPDVRKLLSNVSDRKLLPFVKSGAGKTSANLYPVNAAIGLRVIREITLNGRSYDFASAVANHVMNLATDLVASTTNSNDLDVNGTDWLVVFETLHDGRCGAIKTVRNADLGDSAFAGAFEFGVIAAGDLIWNVVRQYPDYWARDRLARGLDAAPGRYAGVDDSGNPLDPAHPWNANLSPLDRAKRLVEIEEFIAKRDGGEVEK